MDLRQLRYFEAIVQCGSISRASLQLSVAQPALSLHIRNMEAEFGTPLLFRTSQGVQPTEAGLILMRNAQVILGQLERAQAEIKGSVAEPAGEVRLGLPSSISQTLGVPLVLAARERFPKIKLRVAEAMNGYALDLLRLGRIDLGLLYGLVEEPGLRSISLLSEALVLFGPANKASANAVPNGSSISVTALADFSLILPSPGHGLRDLLDAEAAARGVRLQPVMEIDSYAAIKQLVEREGGLSILPAHAVQREVAEKRLHVWSFDPPVMRTIHLVLPAARPLSQAVRAIEGLCRTILADLVLSNAWPMARVCAASEP